MDKWGGKNDIQTYSFSVVPVQQPSINQVPAYNIQRLFVATVVFRSKHHGWKNYRMNIQMATHGEPLPSSE